MIFKRKMYDTLLEWKKNSNGRTVALIEGARRIGKSTIAKEFAENEYKSHIIIDFNKVDNKIVRLFKEERDNIDLIFETLKAYSGVTLYDRESVIVFDEVQICPEARSYMKYLVEDGRYDYIETGSLINLKKNVENIVIPSEEISFKMYPLDFEEFNWAIGNEIGIDYIRKCYENRTAVGDVLHRKFMNTFREYMLVGGMPEAIEIYINTKSFESVDLTKKTILNLYQNDIRKYAGGESVKATNIYQSIPGQLSKKSKRFIFSNLGGRQESFEDAITWLEEARLVNTCYNVTDPSFGLSLTKDKTEVKCYSSDTGLLVTQCFMDKPFVSNDIYKAMLFDKLNVNEGMIVENYVAQILMTKGYELFYYSNIDKIERENMMEIDFIIVQNKKLNPIEVKSSNYNAHSSIDKFKEKYKKQVGTRYVLHTKDLSVNNDIVYLPLYMVMFL